MKNMVNINQNEPLLNQKQKEKELLDLMIKNHKENELLIKKQKDQTQLNQINQANLKHPLNSTHQQIPYPQKQQKNNIKIKNKNKKITSAPSIPYNDNGFEIDDNNSLIKLEDPNEFMMFRGDKKESVGPGSYDLDNPQIWLKNGRRK